MEENTLTVPDVQVAQNSGVALYERISGANIKNLTDAAWVAGLLMQAKHYIKTIEPQFDIPVKQAHKTHKDILALKEKACAAFYDCEKLAKDKLLRYYGSCEDAGTPVPDLDHIGFSSAWVGEIVDATLIPREYLIPDLRKLTDISGVLKSETNIPGWRAVERKIVSVRA